VNYRQDNWKDLLPLLELAYNSSVNASTGFTPFELDCGWIPRTPHDIIASGTPSDVPSVAQFVEKLQSDAEKALEQMQLTRDRQATYVNKKRRSQRFHVGDLVLVSSKHI
ncbi:hypothetical protein EXIGLDRAFT_580347, partial [Exidia glandulosa HHB12029]